MASSRFFWFLLLVSCSVHASIDTGLNWLQSQGASDGSFASADISTSLQSTSEASDTLRALGQAPSATTLQWINVADAPTTEALSRKIVALAASGSDVTALISSLISTQNLDGGFGEGTLFQSTAIDTAYALDALAAAKSTDMAVLRRAIGFLQSTQLADGSFDLFGANVSSLYVTATVSSALQKYRIGYQVSTTIAAANKFLVGQKGANGAWASDWETAVALLALAPAGTDMASLQPAMTALQGNQFSDGSWGQSVYVTALSLQALSLTSNLAAPAGGATLTGRVLDQTSNLPLGATITAAASGQTYQATAGGDGSFSLIAPANQYNVTVSATGYLPASLTSTMQSGQIASLGTVSLVPNANVATVNGTVKDAVTGLPVAGAQVVATTSTGTVSVTTGTDGRYSLSLAGGVTTLSASANGYAPVSLQASLSVGMLFGFSPTLRASATTGPVSVQGKVVDLANGQPITNAAVQMTGGASVTTDATGAFNLTALSAGEITLQVSSTGHLTAQLSLLAAAGESANLGLIRLSSTSTANSGGNIITGYVTDIDSQAPIALATVSVGSSKAVTDVTGHFALEVGALSQLTLTAQAVGYSSTSSSLTLSQSGASAVNFSLKRSGTADFSISEMSISEPSYPANQDLTVVAVFKDTGTTPYDVFVNVEVLDPWGNVIENRPAIQNFGSIPTIHVDAGTQFTFPAQWNTGSYLPGAYSFVIQAFNATTGQLLAERALPVGIDPTLRVGGMANFDPPITMQNQPVHITATVSNSGNLPVNAGTATLRVQVQNPGYAPPSFLSTKVVAQANGPMGMARDASGNLYVANYNSGVVTQISPDGSSSTFMSGLANPVDVYIDADGNFYALNQHNSFVKRTAAGVISTIKTNVPSQVAIAAKNGNVYVATSTNVYEFLTDGTSKTLTSGSLSAPAGMAVNSKGEIFIASSGTKSIVRLTNAGLQLFASGIPNPTGLGFDSADNLYVTSFSQNTLYRVSPSGQVALVASGFSGPFDVKIGSDGLAYVVNYSSNSIVSVDASGNKTVVVPRAISSPRASAFGSSGQLYVANNGYYQLARIEPTGAIKPLGTYDVSAVDMVQAADGIYFLTAATLYRIDSNDALQTVAKISNGTALSAASGGGVYVSTSSGSMLQVSPSGGVATLSVPEISTNPQTIRSDGSGGFYVQSSGRFSHVSATFDTQVTTLPGVFTGALAVGPQGVVYVADYTGRQILEFDASGARLGATMLSFSPGPVAVCPSGDLYVAQYGTTQIYRILNGTSSLYSTLPVAVNGDMLCDASGTLWAALPNTSRVYKVGSGTTSTYITGFNNPSGLNQSADGKILVTGLNEVKKLDPVTGAVITLLASPALPGSSYLGTVQNGNGHFLALRRDGLLLDFGSDLRPLDKWASLSNPQGLVQYNGQLLAADTFGLLQFNPGKLPRIWSDQTGYGLALDAQGNVLLSSRSGVLRLDSLGNATTLIAGYSSLGKIASDPANGIAIEDANSNIVAIYDQTGVKQRDYTGISYPRALAFDSTGKLYVGTATSGIYSVDSTGRVSFFGGKGLAVRYMYWTASGQLIVSSSTTISSFDANGTLVSRSPDFSSLSGGNEGVAPGTNVTLFAGDSGAVYSWDGTHVGTVTSGTGQLSDLAVREDGALLAADAKSGLVENIGDNGTITLAYSGLPAVSGLAVNGTNVAASYATNNIAHYDSTGERTEYPVAKVFNDKIGALVLADDGRVSFDALVKNAVYSLDPNVSATPIQAVGTVVFTQSISRGALATGTQVLDFGTWTPPASGDYVATIQFDQAINSEISGNIHVGATAAGVMSPADPFLPSGDQPSTVFLRVTGSDTAAVTKVDANHITFLGALGGAGGEHIPLAADSQGNVYMSKAGWSPSTTGIFKISPTGAVSQFSPIVARGGMGVDDANNIYASPNAFSAKPGLLRFDPSGQIQAISSPNRTPFSLAVAGGQVYSTSNDGNVYITSLKDSSTRTLPISAGQMGPAGFIAANDSGTMFVTYIDKSFGFSNVYRVLPDGTTSLYGPGIHLEGEAQAITTDCNGNLIYSHFAVYAQGGFVEENAIVQVDAATGQSTKIFSGSASLPGTQDIDALYYDRFGQRLIMWTDVSGGSMYSFPVTCGGLNETVNLVTRSDVDLNSATPAPTSSTTLSTGDKVYTWNLSDVTQQGQAINLNVFFRNLTEGEVRPLFKDAYITMSNAFAPGQVVKVPIAIPSITAASGITLGLSLDKLSLGSGQPVTMALALKNNSATSFTGTVELSIEDGKGNLVQRLPSVPVLDVLAFSEADYSEFWNSGNTYAGTYQVRATVRNSNGVVVTTQLASLQIVAGQDVASAALTSTLSADKLSYDAWDPVKLSATLTNTAANATFNPAAAALVITRPDGSVVYSGSAVVGALYPKAVMSVPFTVFLADEPSETLTATLSVMGADGLSMAGAATSFTVVRTPTAGLIGYVDTTSGWVYQGDPNTCTETVTNYGAADVANATVRHQLISIATGQVLQEKTNVRTLTGSGTQVDTWSIATQGMPIGDYGCVLSVLVAGQEKSLAMGGFQVKEPPIKIAAQWNPGTQGRVLVLLDHPVNDDDHTGSCEKRGEELTLLTPAAGVPLTAAVEAQLLDAQGTVVATTHLPAAANDDNSNLAVVAFDANGLSVRVRSEGAHVYAVKTTLVSDGNTVQYTTGPMTIDCQGPLVKQSVGDFTVVEADSASNDPARPTLVAQQAFLEGVLKADHWNYAVVNDATAFANELQHGGYSAYLLLNRKVKLPETLQRELVEAVNRGEGLLVAGDHDDHNHKLDEALGISHRGKLAMAGGVSVAGTDWLTAGQGAFAFNAHANRVQLNGASVIGRYTGVVIGHESDAPDNDEDDRQDTTVVLENDVAVTSFTYGRGRSLYVGFDLLAEATQTGNASFFGELLRRTASHAHPDQIEMKGGVAIPLIVHLENQGMAVSGQVVATLPAGTRVIDAASGTVQPDGTVLWPYTLAVGQSLDLPLLAIYTDGPQMLTANVQAMKSGVLTDYSTVTNTLTLAPAPSWDNALLSASALPKANTGFTRTSRDLGQAKSAFDKLLYVDALNFLTKAAQPLKGTSDTTANDLRFTIDDLIRDVAGRLP